MFCLLNLLLQIDSHPFNICHELFSQIIHVVIIPFIASFLWIKINVKLPYNSTI